MAKVARRESVKVVEDKVKLNIDVEMSNVLVQYALSKFPSNMHLSNLRHLLDVIDIESYIYNYDIYNRLMLTKYILEARLDRELTNLTLIKQDVINTDSTMEDLVNCIDLDKADDNVEVGKMVLKVLPQIKPLLKQIFPGVTDSEIRCAKVKELVPIFVSAFKYAFSEIGSLADGKQGN